MERTTYVMLRQRILKTAVLAAAMAALPIPLLAQSTITAQAVVKGGVKEESTRGMHFGELDAVSGTASDRAVDVLATGFDDVNGHAGLLDFKLNKDQTEFQFSLPASLTNGSGASLAVASWECGLMVGDSPNTVTDPGDELGLSDFDNACSSSLYADLSGENGARRVRVYIGGMIQAATFADVLADNYQETITVTVIVP
ncbi:hypothetical protein ACFL3S_08255 [Gemmatimonadota bacterium]